MEDLLTIIKQRHSSRGNFDPDRPVPKESMQMILEAGCWAPTAHNMQNFEIIVISDKRIIRAIAAINVPVTITFVRENYKQLSFSEEELLQKRTGVLDTMFPPSWRKPDAGRYAVLDEDRKLYLKEELNSTPVLGIVLYDPTRRAPASAKDFLGAVSLGCVLENMWLMANSLGIDVQIISSLSTGSVASVIKKMLKIPEGLKIAYCFRMGYAETRTEGLRVRRKIEDFAFCNKYGEKAFK